jgi:CRP-like cAMP-binding protein
MPDDELLAPSPEVQDEEFRDEVLDLIEGVLAAEPAEPAAPAGDGAPMVDTPLFRSLAPPELVAVIRKMRLSMYEPGEVIVAEGQPGDSLFIITTGRVRAYVCDANDTPVEARQLAEGDFFGEISILQGGRRTATVVAADTCELLEFDKKSLDEISAQHPNVRQVMVDFARQRTGGSAS